MSRNTRKTAESTPTTDNPPVGVAVGVSAEDVEEIVAKAVSAATTVVRDEFLKHINDLHLRLQLVEAAVEGMNLESVSATVLSVQKETADLAASLNALQTEMRQHAAAANDAAQYLRRNNVRIRGLQVKENEDCRKVVTEFIRKTLHIHLDEDHIEAAHILPARSSQSASTPPTVVVRFFRRELRDSVIRSRRMLKDSKMSIVEDLTSLNLELLNRLRNSASIDKVWSWNGHVRALLKNGKTVHVRPFQSVEGLL